MPEQLPLGMAIDRSGLPYRLPSHADRARNQLTSGHGGEKAVVAMVTARHWRFWTIQPACVGLHEEV
jgi:hypothetical protein